MAAKWSMLVFSLGLLLPLQTAKKSVWDGAYTNAQAERGQKAYTGVLPNAILDGV
jgi:hypothetical protein